jgi:hypothetical protein
LSKEITDQAEVEKKLERTYQLLKELAGSEVPVIRYNCRYALFLINQVMNDLNLEYEFLPEFEG